MHNALILAKEQGLIQDFEVVRIEDKELCAVGLLPSDEDHYKRVTRAFGLEQ